MKGPFSKKLKKKVEAPPPHFYALKSHEPRVECLWEEDLSYLPRGPEHVLWWCDVPPLQVTGGGMNVLYPGVGEVWAQSTGRVLGLHG